jgi:hypothetical protein
MAQHSRSTPRPAERARRGGPPLSPVPRSPYWAFVVQLQPDASGSPTQLAGRVEHVVSGRAAEFRSVAALVAFMRRTGGSE